MTERELKLSTAIVAVALAAVVVIGAIAGQARIADDLQPQARGALDAAGLGSVRVDVTGREAEVSVGSAQQLAMAAQIVSDVAGIRWVTVDYAADAPGRGR